MIPWLDRDRLEFPPLGQALTSPNGLLAAGGDLSAARLLLAYRSGIFPWYEQGQPILWWSPDPRTVIFPHKLHISRSLRKTLRRQHFEISADRAFERVISACATRGGSSLQRPAGTWITREMHSAYCHLHQLGRAHSIEAWAGDELAGGLYGIAIGRLFFGESMFSLVRDASKVAFVHLLGQLAAWGFEMVDCQVASDHLFSLGAEQIPRQQFAQMLVDYIDSEPAIGGSLTDSGPGGQISAGTGRSRHHHRWQLTWHYHHD